MVNKKKMQSIATGAALLAGLSSGLLAQNNVTGVNDLSNLQHQRLTGTSDMNGSTTGIVNGRANNPNTNGADLTPSMMDFGAGSDMSNQGPFVTLADKQFAQGVASRGMVAIQLSRVATERGSTAEVKGVGQMMLDDYLKWTSGITKASNALGIRLPATLDAKHQATVSSIEGLSGPQFDAAYLKEMVSLNNKALTVTEYEAANAGVSGFRHWAGVMVPHIQDELKMTKQAMSGASVISKK